MCLGGVKSYGSINEPKELKSKASPKSFEDKVSKGVSQDDSSSSQISDKSQILGEMKKISKFDPANPKVNIGKIMDGEVVSVKAKGMYIPIKDPSKIIENTTPIKDSNKIIENIKNSKGEERDSALLNFQNDIDKMPEKNLKGMRDNLVKEMSSDTNKDDRLLGSLLNIVNKEIDSRGNFGDFRVIGKLDSHSHSNGSIKSKLDGVTSQSTKINKMSEIMNNIGSNNPKTPAKSEAPQQAIEIENDN